VVAAISLAGPSFRLTREDLPARAPRLLRAADDFGRRLGNLS
jgi:DNA-binding IclR family transcriptional regulator